MKKRIISAGLAAILATSALATSAFADIGHDLVDATPTDDVAVGGNSVSLTSVINIPTIKVTAPTGDAQFVLNPYKLEVVTKPAVAAVADDPETDEDETVEAQDAVTSKEQVVSKLLQFQNKSDVPINLYAKAAGTIASEDAIATIAKAAPKAGDTGNQIFLFVVSSAAGKTAPESIAPATYNAKTHATVTEETETVKAPEIKMVTLDAAGAEKNVCAALAIQGSMSSAPAKPWTADDVVDVTLTYRFEALINS